MSTATEIYAGVDSADFAFLGLLGPKPALDDGRCGPTHSNTDAHAHAPIGVRSRRSHPLPMWGRRRKKPLPTQELPRWAWKALRDISKTVSIASRGGGEPVAVRVKRPATACVIENITSVLALVRSRLGLDPASPAAQLYSRRVDRFFDFFNPEWTAFEPSELAYRMIAALVLLPLRLAYRRDAGRDFLNSQYGREKRAGRNSSVYGDRTDKDGRVLAHLELREQGYDRLDRQGLLLVEDVLGYARRAESDPLAAWGEVYGRSFAFLERHGPSPRVSRIARHVALSGLHRDGVARLHSWSAEAAVDGLRGLVRPLDHKRDILEWLFRMLEADEALATLLLKAGAA